MNTTPANSTGLEWSELDDRAVDTVRLLAMDAVEKVGNGHPGTAMSLAPVAYTLYQRVLRHDPSDPGWLGRDRFVLSAGHSSLTQYIQLYLAGYNVTLDDLKSFRTWGSKTPGHPEYGHTEGVEVTTGPLGSGFGSAVGMAFAARRVRGLLDPDAAPGESIFDHHIYVIASDGDLEEGVSSEASSLAGTQELGNLIVLWDDNKISIEDDTNIAFTEDTIARYEAYGWHTQVVDFTGPEYREDPQAVFAALQEAKQVTDRPSFIAVRTTIGWPAPNKQNTGAIHGSALGADEVAATKRILGADPEKSFDVADDVIEHTQLAVDRGKKLRAEWEERYLAWREANPERAALLDRLRERKLPAGWTDALPEFEPSEKGIATRAASGKVLNAIAPVLPELWGGSADLAGSNNTTITGEPSFLPEKRSSEMFPGHPYGRTLHFGVREFAAGLIANGIALNGLTRPYAATFLVFSDYQRAAVRLAAVQQIPTTFVWTHDSIGLGEDGPTHQPVEHLSALRAIPGFDVVRPADANETAVAWRTILERGHKPAGIALTRQGIPTFDRSVYASAEGVAKGAYVFADAATGDGNGEPRVILMASGSELQLAVEARERLQAEGVPTRVVSFPSHEWFEEQSAEYKESVLPASVKARVSVEAGVAMSWHRYLGDAGRAVSLEHFGASADYKILFREYGFTPEAVVAAAKESIEAAR
ncbi:transketolase [Phytoactinopolyspora halotolerans]|uniref:Transketolase n=1 Tax=Phytoactinopolyspora halotolerans TaxID=1981512 RepID=A0A6L9SAQ2_9ACTN|nr:transketolase [Phytoactinopolyspora halotolerans]NEE02169.1 transketolase [Phytoactinopolyspora halotolerans]